MKANCLFCHYLNVKKAQSKCGYWERGFGDCSIWGYHIRKNIRNCTKFSKIGPHYQDYVDWLDEYADNIKSIASLMNEQKYDWYDTLRPRVTEEET